MATLQQQVQQHLQNTGISLRELGRQAGVSHNVVSRVLQGKRVHPINHNKLSRTVAIARKTLDATVEQLAVQRVNADLTHHADLDVDLQCAKYRRVMQLEQQLNDANTAYLSSKSQHERDLQRLNALSETHGQSWKAVSVERDQLQKQLDHGQAAHSKLCSQLGATRAKYETQLEAANQKETRLQEQLTEVYATKTRQEAQVMRLRVYAWSLVCAIVPLIVSGLVVWGGV